MTAPRRRNPAELAISPAGIALITKWEGFVPYPYDDHVYPYREWTGGPLRGTATIGFGHTNLTGLPPTVRPGLRLTRDQALSTLKQMLAKVYEPAVRRNVTVPLAQNEYDALVSLVYNMGEPNFRKSSLLAKLNARDYAGAAASFKLYRTSGGKVMQGLVNRRADEERMFRAVTVLPREAGQATGSVAVGAGTGVAVTEATGSDVAGIVVGGVIVALVIGFVVWKRRGK